MAHRTWGSLAIVRLGQRAALAALLLLAGAVPSDRGVADAALASFVDQTTRRWCEAHGRRDDLQVVVIDVHFRPEPPLFKQAEGVVVAPVAIELARSQHVLEIASQPGHVRQLSAQGVTALAWPYAGRLHRPMRFAGLALVERPPLRRVTPASSTFAGLPADRRAEASARAADLEEHGLDKCAAFAGWARQTAGAPPHTEQILRLVRAVAHRTEDNQREPEDVCAAIRADRFTPHRAQVAAVMGARELGIPTYGFAAASNRQLHLVGTYDDQAGWILLDVERPEDGWFTGGPPLVVMAPLLGGFSASSHDFWSPAAGAYAQQAWGVSPVSTTSWRGTLRPDQLATDTTEARVQRLSDVCR